MLSVQRRNEGLLDRLLPGRQKRNAGQSTIAEEQCIDRTVPDNREDRNVGMPLTGEPGRSTQIAGRNVRLAEHQHHGCGNEGRSDSRQTEANCPGQDLRRWLRQMTFERAGQDVSAERKENVDGRIAVIEKI